MIGINELSKSKNIERILDENNCPVARMRLFSEGIQTNNRILQYEPITSDKGCLACGNCIDNCPVVRDKLGYVFPQNLRSSMSLENIVNVECRRCYACVRACPQVSKTVKEYAIGFRRGEKITHVFTAALIFFLAATGIFMFHYQDIIPNWQRHVIKTAHSFAGILLLLSPLLYFLLDRSHLKRALNKVFRYSNEDIVWLKNFWLYLKEPKRQPLPAWQEFNTYHKFWFAYLLIVVPLLGFTGIINFFGGVGAKTLLFGISLWVHSFFAFTTDILVITHIYFKFIRFFFRDISDVVKSTQKNKNLHFPFLYDPKSSSTPKASILK